MDEMAREINKVLDDDFGKTKLQHKFLQSDKPLDRPTATAIIDLVIGELQARIRELEEVRRKLA